MSNFKPEFLEAFLETAVERHRVYKKKEAGLPKPWTDNAVLRDFFFCNLFRQYDKCSKWIIEKVVPYGRWDLLVLYRFISTHSTFLCLEEAERMGHIELDSLDDVEECLRQWKEDGAIFSGCFIRNPSTSKGMMETYKAVFQHIEDIKKCEDHLQAVIRRNSLEELCAALKTVTGIAGFMSYEYACDFSYTDWFNPTDTMTWANMGPGAQRGMSILLTGNRYQKIPFNTWLSYARELLPLLKERVEKEFPEEVVTMREVEHWLCEFQKYCKYVSFSNGGDKVKHRKYNGGI